METVRNKWNTAGGICQSLERDKLPKLTEGEEDTLSRPVTTKEIERMTQSLSTKETPGPGVCLLMAATKHLDTKHANAP